MDFNLDEMSLEELNELLEKIQAKLESLENPESEEEADETLEGLSDDIDELAELVDQIDERKNAIMQKAQKRSATIDKIKRGAGTVKRAALVKEESKMTYTRENIAAQPEYRSAFLKNLCQRDGVSLLGEMNVQERAAFTFATGNTGAVVPTDTLNRIIELVKSENPIYSDANITNLTRGFGIPRHKAIAAGDAKGVAEGTANDDENDTFDLLSLDGIEIKKHVVITRKMQFQSIDAFEGWLVKHLADRIGVAKERQILARLDGTAPEGGTANADAGIAAANKLAAAEATDATIRKAMGQIETDGEVIIYANRQTIWNKLFGIVDGENRQLFLPNSMSDPIIQGHIYGAAVKSDNNIADNVAYFITKGQVLANDFSGMETYSAVEPKTVNTIITGYSLFDSGLENPKGAVKVTFKTT